MPTDFLAWRDEVATRISQPPAGFFPCVVDGELVLVPEKLRKRDPRALTVRDRNQVVRVCTLGLAEGA